MENTDKIELTEKEYAVLETAKKILEKYEIAFKELAK